MPPGFGDKTLYVRQPLNGGNDMTAVSFPGGEPLVRRGVSVIFSAEADGNHIKCAITSEACVTALGETTTTLDQHSFVIARQLKR